MDSNIEHYAYLLQGLVPNVRTHVLSCNQDGVTQISNRLSQYQKYTNISAIHIVSHGLPGCLYLGNHELSLRNLDKYSPILKTWFSNRSLFHNANGSQKTLPNSQLTRPKLCLYGCNVASGDAGEEFITKLANITGADVLASSSPVGHHDLGGNWELDKTTGFPETLSIPVSETTQASWVGLLNDPKEAPQNRKIQSKEINASQHSVSGDTESIVLQFSGQPTTLNGQPIQQRSLIKNADIIRVRHVATTFDGTVIDGLIRAIDTGSGMAYDPANGELSCPEKSEPSDSLLRVNLQFVETGTDIEVCLPNLTAQFWNMETAGDTAEVVGFSNADSMHLTGLPTDNNVADRGNFLNKVLTYQLQVDAADNVSDTPDNLNNNPLTREVNNSDSSASNISDSVDNAITSCATPLIDDGHDIDYRVTAQFKQFTSTDIAYGIAHTLFETTVVSGLQLNALTITKATENKDDSQSQTTTHSGYSPNDRSPFTSSASIVGTPLSVLFLDTNTQGYGKLLTSVKPGVHIYALNNREDGIEQITRVLSDRYRNSTIQSLHIVANGAPGCLYLGTGELNPWTFDAYKHQIMRWKASSIYLDSCNVASGEAGYALIAELQMLLNVPVLASTHRMGNAGSSDTHWISSTAPNNLPVAISSKQSPFHKQAETGSNILPLRNR